MRSRTPASSVAVMEHTEPRGDLFAGLDLFLREPDREDEVLPDVLRDAPEPEEALNSQILAGLVSP